MQTFTGWRRNLLLAVIAMLLCASTSFAQRRGGRGGGGDAFSFRWVGPAVGNRVSAITGIPGDPSTYYAGGARAAFGKPPTAATIGILCLTRNLCRPLVRWLSIPILTTPCGREPAKLGRFATLM